MSIKDFFADLFSTKASASRAVSVISMVSQPQASKRNLEQIARESYDANSVAYTAISKIARTAAQIPWELFERQTNGDLKQVTVHPLLDLIRKPNPLNGQSCFFECITAWYWITGNLFIEGVTAEIPDKQNFFPVSQQPPLELYCVRPDRMRILNGSNGFPHHYEFMEQGHSVVWDVDPIDMNSQILHIKTFNTNDITWGMSPFQPLALSVDQHNQSSTWNLALLKNSARPAGNFIVEKTDSNPKGKLNTNQRRDVEVELREKYSGAPNAGRSMIIQGGVKWQQTALNAKEMDWIKGKNSTAREIANGLGYPPMLLGIEGDNTFSNQKEARLSLLEDTIFPYMNIVQDEWNNWLVPKYGQDNLVLRYNPDMIPVIAEKKRTIWAGLSETTWMTDNEKREQAGFEPIVNPLADEIYKSATLIPLSQMSEDFGDDDDDDDDDNTDHDDDDKSILESGEHKQAEDLFQFFLENWIESRGAEKITQIHGVTKEKVIRNIRDAIIDNSDQPVTVIAKEIQRTVKKTYVEFSRARAIKIARTETLIASNQGSLEAAKDLKIPNMMKEWVPSNDGRSRDTHRQMEGVKVGVHDLFSVPSEKSSNTQMDGPGDPTAPPGQVINCRCTLVYSRDQKLFNLKSAIAKRRFWFKTNRQRLRDVKRFRTGIRKIFRSERDDLLDALDGLKSFDQIEIIVASVLNKNEDIFKEIFKKNYTAILNRFAKEVFNIGVDDG